MKHESYILKATGEKVLCSPKNGSDFQLQELKEAIGGGYIEVCRIPNSNHIMVIDEEGKLKHMPVNHAATIIYDNPNDIIVGDALVCHSSQVK